MLLTLAILVVTILSASAVGVDVSRRSGGRLGWPLALAWQGAEYLSWTPFLWAASAMIGRLGLSSGLFWRLYALTVVAALAHALIVLWLDDWLVGQRASLTGFEMRAPVDLLMAVAIAAAVAAVQAQRTVARARAQAQALEQALEAARHAARPVEPVRLMVSVGARKVMVDPVEVEWFAAAGNYVVVNWAGREGLMRETLSSLSERLPPEIFARSHRSTLVNLARVADAQSLADGSWRLTLQSGAELVVSRTYRDLVLGRLRGAVT